MRFYTTEQRRIDNGKIVTNALQSMDGRGSMNNLLELISYHQGLPIESVKTQLKQVLRRGIESGFLVKRGTTYHFTAPPQYQLDGDQNKKRSRSRSRSPSTPQKTSSPSEIMNRRMKTPYRRLKGANPSSSRVAAINQRMRDEEAVENERARTGYRQPKHSPKRRKVTFDLTPKSEKKRSPQDAYGSSPELSPSKIRKLNFDDDDDDDLEML
ncbi:hypothetical protein HA402_007688 [Bradysia odoriphaga]|nr:hypothetical protein HA402_007688 [Bradysia odoriphaga]